MNDNRKTQIQTQWQNKYYECLVLEFSNPEYFAVHHLLVITYMIQSDGYSDAYFPQAVHILKNFINETITTEQFLIEFEAMKKNGKIENMSEVRDIGKYNWNLDIMSVRTYTAELYCSDIKDWARDVLNVIEMSK